MNLHAYYDTFCNFCPAVVYDTKSLFGSTQPHSKALWKFGSPAIQRSQTNEKPMLPSSSGDNCKWRPLTEWILDQQVLPIQLTAAFRDRCALVQSNSRSRRRAGRQTGSSVCVKVGIHHVECHGNLA